MATKKPIAKAAAQKVAPKPVAKKATAKPITKAAAKKVAPKPVAKKATAKPVAKAATKKVAPKAVAKKAAVKPVTKKATAKPVVKAVAKKVAPKAVAKKVAVKPVPKTPTKKVTAKPAAKKVAPKAPVKPVAKVPAKKVVAKPVVKKEAKANVKPEVKKAQVKPIAKPAKKPNTPAKTIISSTLNVLPKKADVYKTNTFGTSNLKNESGKIIAHRPISELGRGKNKGRDTKHEPEERRSILDMNTNTSGPSFRYSDEDLLEFKELILRKLETAKAELQYLQGVIMRKDEGGTEDTENKYQNMEDGSASMEREQFTQLASRQITFISHLEQAMVRIENKTYGICRETGKLIDKARLRAVPHATLSIEAKNAKKN